MNMPISIKYASIMSMATQDLRYYNNTKNVTNTILHLTLHKLDYYRNCIALYKMIKCDV